MTSNFHGNPPPRILIVEDGLIMARDIERRLQSLGYVVVGLAQSGEEAVRAVTNLKPDLILMDVNLRGPLDGIQAAAKIHAMVDVPVVYVTAYSDEATLTRARETEPFGYVLKPFDEKELRTTIEMSLYRHDLYRRMRESEQRYRMVADQSTLFSYAFRVLTDGTLRLEWVTDGFGRMTGLPSDTISHLEDHVHPEDAPVMRIRCRAMAAGKEVVSEYRMRTGKGEYVWVRDQASPMEGREEKENIRIIGTVQDISTRKAAEDQVQEGLRFQETRDRDIYVHLTELSRRLMFLMESRAGSTKGKAESWDDTIAHVKDLLQVHDSVYSSGSIRNYPVGRQMQTLAARLFKRLGQARVTYTVDADPLEMDVRLASGLLLIMQELVTNSLQHAFPSVRKGHVKIFLKETEGKGILLQVSDDGIGLRKDVDVRKVRNGGLEFVRKLAAGMKGSVDVERGEGTSFRIEIPT